MSGDDAPKSAVELAMEKLRARGFEETVLSGEQKAEIAEIRARARAKIAEAEIQHETKRRAAASFEELEKLDDELKKDKARIEADAEKAVAKVRSKG